MALALGTKLGPYDIVALLGAGGMGEVYRATDSRLGRDVALKVLPEAFARDAQRMARFEREAKFLASLNHPNIASIYGLEESDGTRALVMELVEGQTLGERIKNGPLALDEALPAGKQIAEGLEYAHERGIIHRDLKPANVKVRSDGTVKILDFGLAKALEETPAAGSISDSATISAAASREGMILGTAAYMSPEQARGKPVDKRADIWAFGVVLHEMLTGRHPFSGETVSDTLAAVITKEPNWERLPPSTPPRIGQLLRRCLTKDPRQRLQAIGEARIVLDETLSGDVGAGLAPPTGVQQAEPLRQRWRGALPWLVLSGLTLIAGIAAGWWASARRNPPSLNWSAQMLGGPSVAIGPRISPDGHTLAFQAMVDGPTQVAVMDTESADWTILTKNRSRGYVTEVNWSPNSSEIYFDRQFSVPHGIYRVSRFGGDERLVLDDAMGPEVLPDGSLLVLRVNNDRILQLYHFWPESGRLEALSAFFPEVLDFTPVRVFRDGKDAVFFGKPLEQDKADPSPHLYVINLTSGESRRLAPELDLRLSSSLPVFPIAVAADDRSVFVDLEAGDLHRVISIPRDSTGTVRTMLTLTLSPLFMDVGKEGDLYLDQLDRPIEALRFSVAGGTPESIAGSESTGSVTPATLHLPDGRVVFESLVAGRSTLLAAKPGVEAAPFIQTKEETNLPACRLGEDELAFLLGSARQAVVAVASIADGRIVRRLSEIPGKEVTDLAASPDGKTLYYVASKTVWAIPATGGQPHRISSGDAVAAGPNGKDLIVQLYAKEGIRLMRVPVSGGVEQPIPFQSALRQTFVFLSPNAIGKDGRVLLTVASADSWFYGPAVLDPQNGKVDRIPLKFAGDVVAPEWLDDGRILAVGRPTKVTLWRFHSAELGR